ncbi:aminoacyl-tRNA hydrolase [bacterium]|nr:MAG: aminoacyl-tRNA hydrolase [bacterium]
MKLIVGLGNPGSRYERTRHNAGFMVIDKLTNALGISLRAGKGEYAIGDGNHAGERVWLMKPTTYMNNSGMAVREVVQFHKLALQDILIICDDAALPVGKIRLRKSGSDGGQNGLKSVIFHLNSDQFPRLRVGIANDLMQKMDLADFVLSRFDASEIDTLHEMTEHAKNAALEFIQTGDIELCMNKYNSNKNND